MKVCTVVFGLLVVCTVSYAQLQHGPVFMALQQPLNLQPAAQRQVAVVEQPTRQKRSLLLGATALGLGAAGLVGAGLVGATALGAAGLKAGLIGGALASGAFSGRSYGGGYGGSYGGGYYAPAPVVYGGYRSYPAYYVEDEWC